MSGFLLPYIEREKRDLGGKAQVRGQSPHRLFSTFVFGRVSWFFTYQTIRASTGLNFGKNRASQELAQSTHGEFVFRATVVARLLDDEPTLRPTLSTHNEDQARKQFERKRPYLSC